ncbi:hypothetical protein HDV03_002996 [Kappamyces sp. JEL0829]|nr:hypothetical protein HDV03_002996 [Kappamyces sp. JEL0829]
MAEVKQDVYSQNHHISFLVDLTAGIFGGCLGVLSGHPFDTIKVRLQTQTKGSKMGVVSCFQSIVKKEGVAGLYKGMASPMVGVAVVNSLLFAVYGTALRLCAKDPENPTVSDVFIAGCISGSVNGFFSCPMELIKIRLQNQTNSRREANRLYQGPVDCIRKIVRKDGVRGLMRGLPTTLVREIPSYGAYFAAYEVFCRMIPNADPNVPSVGILLAGGFAGVVGWLSTYPVDVVKTRLQSIQEDRQPKYHNLRNGFRIILREEGYRVFFSGLGATAIRAFPTNAAVFAGVVVCRNFLEKTFGLEKSNEPQ